MVPYEENRVELIPTKENNTGYINASHIKVRRGACWEGWLKIAGLTVKMQGGENRRAATAQFGWSPNPEGVFELMELFLVNSKAMPTAAERRKPRASGKTSGQLFLKLDYGGFNFFLFL